MAWTYMLRGDSGRYYIGSTDNLLRRLEEHRRGETHTTKRLGGNLILVASVELASMAEARALERAMKQKRTRDLRLDF